MKARITRDNGLIYRVKTETSETVYGKGLTDWEYILLMRTYRKYRNQLTPIQ